MGSEWANWVVLFSQTLTRNYSLNVSKHLIPLTQFMNYLESTKHFNLLSPRTCDFGLKCKRSMLDYLTYYYELESIISALNESIND